MTEHPILFSSPMIRAILSGSKTQTRRVVKPQPTGGVNDWGMDAGAGDVVMYHGWPTRLVESRGRNKRAAGELTPQPYKCPYGAAGDAIWVRETFSGPDCMEATRYSPAAPPSKWGLGARIWYWADGNPPSGDWTRPRPSIHMPRWASRITLRITDVRVERLQDLSDEDALAEGINRIAHGREGYYYHATRTEPHPHNWCYPADAFRDLWDGLNTKRGAGWNTNPLVWVISFECVEPKP